MFANKYETASIRMIQMRYDNFRVASCQLPVASCQLRVGFYLYCASCELRVASCELRVASCELRVASWFSIISIQSILLFQFLILAKVSYEFLR